MHLKLSFNFVSVMLESRSPLHGLILCLQGAFLLSENFLVCLLKSLIAREKKSVTLAGMKVSIVYS